jgi:hypothetical protein
MSKQNRMVHIIAKENTYCIISFEINPVLFLSNDFARAILIK